MGFLIYSSGISAPLHLDDPNVLQIAERGTGWSVRALGFASFWLNRQLMLVVASVLPWREPFYYRLVNVFIHALAATALFWFIFEITGRRIAATIGGVLFLVHPVQTQAVTYITQRFESQAAMFMFCSGAAYARFRRTNSKLWIAPTVLFAIAAALTKETAVALPLWLLLIELVFFEGAGLRKLAICMVVFGLPLVIPVLRAFQNAGTATFGWVPWHEYFLTQGPILTKYFELVTWPRRQFLYYDFQPITSMTWPVLLEWLLVLVVVASGLYLLRRYPLIGFGIISFFIFLLPVILLPLPDLINEHRLYGAFAGVSIALAGLVQAINRKWVFVLVGILATALAVKTARRNAEWNDQLQFLEKHAAAFPHDPQTLSRLASYYYSNGYVNKSIEFNLEARRYEDRFNNYYSQQGRLLIAVNLATAYLAKNDLASAELEAHRAIALNPKEGMAWRVLGYVLLEERRPQEAVTSFRKYVDLSSSGVEKGFNFLQADAWDSLRIAATRAGDSETAKLANDKLNIESQKVAAEKGSVVQIPDKYKTYGIFGVTLTLLMAIAWAVQAVWIDVRSLYGGGPGNSMDSHV